eukprot:m.157852 g.157852  ORF g.157852 m.157852 type:complete len:383 (+) comp38715_c1_seq14:94-1242(+)
MKPIKRVSGLTDVVKAKLAKNGVLTCKEFLTKNSLELMKILGVTRETLKSITTTVAKSVAPKPKTVSLFTNLLYAFFSTFSCKALALKSSQKVPRFLPTSLAPLDAALGGGLPVSSLTEIVGPSGSGKTQFCTMLAMIAALPRHLGGLDGGVVYIDTEAAFSAERLTEMVKASRPECGDNPALLEAIFNRIHVYFEPSTESLNKRIESLQEVIIEKAARLIIIDSIASPVRREQSRVAATATAANGRKSRLDVLAHQAAMLKDLAEAFQIPVILTNQITTKLDGEQGGGGSGGSTGAVTAALGPVWPHFPTTRLLVHFSDETVRQIVIAKSPVAPCLAFDYTIESQGIVMVRDGIAVEQEHLHRLKSHSDVCNISLTSYERH